MTSLHVVDLSEVLSEMPAVQPLEDVIPQHIDLFICASGFESRVDVVARYLVEHGCKARTACYLTYRDNEDENARLREPLLSTLSKLATTVVTRDVDSPGPEFRLAIEDVLDDVISSSADNVSDVQPVVVLDVSCASTRAILRILPALWHRDIELLFAYGQSRVYFPAAEEFMDSDEYPSALSIEDAYKSGSGSEGRGSSRDSGDPEFMFENPGRHFDGLPDRAVVVAGFNGQRSKVALAFIDPALVVEGSNRRVLWIVGNTLEAEDQRRLDLMLKVNGLAADGDSSDVVTVASRLDYADTLRILEADYEAHFSTERITVIAMGSKMQTLAVALFCEIHPDVRVVLAGPAANEGRHYSSGVRAMWALEFGHTARLRANLASIGQAKLED